MDKQYAYYRTLVDAVSDTYSKAAIKRQDKPRINKLIEETNELFKQAQQEYGRLNELSETVYYEQKVTVNGVEVTSYWSWGNHNRLSEQASIDYFICVSAAGFISGAVAKQGETYHNRLWPHVLGDTSMSQALQSLRETIYQSQFVANNPFVTILHNQLAKHARPDRIETITYEQQREITKDNPYHYLDFTTMSDIQADIFYKVINAKLVSFNFFDALSEEKKGASADYWTTYREALHLLAKGLAREKNLQFVKINHPKRGLQYGLYVR
ncbi:hypothetical protein BAU15_03200 [Enterococcus sp. JM4C]|uniref:hypothetical protein n=1 Tax=Candidatus Enterococcus huntleyi TaxID=1857217 RepID=UPI00137B8781|nr:hypothetical protein [Enterococcus sp. JM4C]KAF1295565.1 hypothetical protein BAU15_03200 [Enterococcus sp. JM4C]